MRYAILLLIIVTSSPASAQLVAPLTTSDGRIACTQGQTGIGRASAWEAVADEQALGGWALAETAGDATDLRFPLCVSTQTVARDVDAVLKFRIVSGTHAQVAGLVLRAQSANDYYVARASATDGTVRLYRVASGRRAELANKTAPVTSRESHTLRVLAKRERFEVFFDSTSLFVANDASLMRPGPVGVWSQADSVTHFQSLLVANPP
jgi:hypothetical protein